MSSAIEMFRQQREAASKVHQQLLDVSRLLNQLSAQAAALSADKELRAALQEEQRWLAEARQLVSDVRYLRQSVDHRWPALFRRWALAGLFALASAWAAGVGYSAHLVGLQDDLDLLRDRAAFADSKTPRRDDTG